MHHEEQNGTRPAEEKIEQAQKPTGVQDEKTHFNDGVSDLVAQQESDTVNFQHKCFEQRQRKKTQMLVFHSETREAVLSGCLVLGKCEQRYFDVGIGGDVIRRTMMAIVFVQPPAVAESKQEV